MWKPGDVIVSRGVYRNKVWWACPTYVVCDQPREVVLALLPGTECLVEETYGKGKATGNRWWDFKDRDWKLAPFVWHTNRLLILHEPDHFYSIRLFWEESSNCFAGYYVNFELPMQRTPCGIDTMDLELDIDIEPNLAFRWKDQEDYQKAIDLGLILPEWAQAIEHEVPKVLDRLAQRQYPFDGSWLNWVPDPNWSLPKLPETWAQL